MVKHKYQSFPDDQMKRYLNTKILRVSILAQQNYLQLIMS